MIICTSEASTFSSRLVVLCGFLLSTNFYDFLVVLEFRFRPILLLPFLVRPLSVVDSSTVFLRGLESELNSWLPLFAVFASIVSFFAFLTFLVDFFDGFKSLKLSLLVLLAL